MSIFHRQYQYNVSPGPNYRNSKDLPSSGPTAHSVRFIAYYLPQFHAVQQNNEWWGNGFTEWTNVTKSVPRFLGHRQPCLPADLGFYDLRSTEHLRKQAELAKRAGIYGFCIHNYWFSGTRLLETPLDNLLSSPDIDLRFCLNWANENWTRTWDGLEKQVLIGQQYAPNDGLDYARSILPALRDPRYIKIDGRPLLMIYRPALLPDAKRWAQIWRKFFLENGVGDPYLVLPRIHEQNDPRDFGFDAIAGFPPHGGGWQLANHRDEISLLDAGFEGRTSSYADLRETLLKANYYQFPYFPGVCPGWDNEARRPRKGVSFYGSSPAAYAEWLYRASLKVAQRTSSDERIVFINAWNEWAEGAYLEPDVHHGHAYLAETRRVLELLNINAPFSLPETTVSNHDRRFAHPQRSFNARLETVVRKLTHRFTNI